MGNFTFQEDGHIYRLDGVEVKSVTQIIQEAGLSDFSKVNPELLDRAIKFGNALHKAVELSCKGTLDKESLDPALMPHLNQWDSFCSDYCYVSKEQEYRAVNTALRVGFCIDQLGYIKGGSVLVDLKTGHPKAADVVQASAYGYLYPIERVLILYLNEDSYKINEIKRLDRKKGEQIFLSCLALYNFKKQEGLL
jgi:hypothetical protein